MIQVSTAFNDAVSGDCRTFRVRFLKDGAEVQCAVSSVTVYSGSSGQNVYPGAVFAPYMAAGFQSTDVFDYTDEFDLEVGVVTADGTTEWMQTGHYTVSNVAKTAYTMQMTAIGNLSAKCGFVYDSALSYPASIASVISEIEKQTGLDVRTEGISVTGSYPSKPNAQTHRDVLTTISALLGGFLTEDNQGRIVIAKYGCGENYEVDGNRMQAEPSLNASDFTVTGIKCIVKDAYTDEDGKDHPAVEYSTGTPNVTIRCDMMSASQFSTMAKNIVGLTFRGGTVDLSIGEPRLEPWDNLLATDLKGNQYTIPCMMLTQSIDGGASTYVTANIDSETASESYPVGSLTSAVSTLQSDMLSVNTALANRATIKDLTVTNEQVSNLSANKADIDMLNVVDGSITNAKIKALDADKITSGTLDAERITGSVITAVNTSSETATINSAKIGDLDAGKITTGSLSSDVMQTNVITAVNASVDDISAERMKTNAIEAVNASVGSATIDSAKIGEIDAGKITTGDISTDRMQANAINAVNADVGTATINSAKIGDLSADKITTGSLSADVMKTNVIGAVNAYVGTATIDGAKIGDLSADKLTSGKIDATKVTISDLTASSITVAKINGVLVTGNADLQSVLGTVSTAVDSVSETADGKNTCYHQSTEPAGEEYASGDLWFDTANDNACYIYDGTAWTLHAFGNTAISNLDAGKITAGTISADRIGANTITSDKIAVGGVAAENIAADTLVAGTAVIDQIQNVTYLDASHINADWLEAGEIKGGSLSLGMLDDASTETLDEMQATANTALDNTTALNESIDGLSSSVDDRFQAESDKTSDAISDAVSQSNETMNQNLQDVQTEIKAAIRENTDAIGLLGQWLTFDQNGGLKVGESGTGYYIQIQGEKISFMNGDTEMYYLSNGKLYIKDAQITSTLSFGQSTGQWAFIPRSNGNLSFRWIGGSN